VLAFLLYVEISQWLGSRGAKLKVGCWVSQIKGGLNGAGHLIGRGWLEGLETLFDWRGYRTSPSKKEKGNSESFHTEIGKPDTN
jgi:hypothetical protein